MEHKTNYIEEDLIKAFKVFDGDDLATVNKDELKVVMMNLIGKDLASEDQIDAMFREAAPQTDGSGNIDYLNLIKIMLNEVDPLHIPQAQGR